MEQYGKFYEKYQTIKKENELWHWVNVNRNICGNNKTT